MKNIFKPFLILAFSVAISEELKLGSDIPMGDVKMVDVSGKKVSLNEVKMENGLLVNFSCNTCPWVIAWQDRYNQLSDLSLANNIGFITINPNSRNREKIGEGLDDMKEFSKKYDHDFLYTVDKNSEIARAFGATSTPHIYLFNSDGKLVYRGAIDDNARNKNKVKESYLSNALDNMLEGLPIKNSETKALGCSIKFN